jgi:hypothetical protein
MRPDQEHDSARLENQGQQPTYALDAGRRICPVMESAKMNLLFGMAKFLRAFEVLPPDADKDVDSSIESTYISDLALRPNKFDVRVKLRDRVSKEDVMKHYVATYQSEAEIMGLNNSQYM